MSSSQFPHQQALFARSAQQATPSAKVTWRIFLDGASRGNPGQAGAGVAIINNNEFILREGFYLGRKTNNQAEYLALAFAAFLIKEQLQNRKLLPHLEFISDSELLVKQMSGLYRVKNPTLARIKHLVEGLLEGIPHSFQHVLRANNTQADALANSGVDKKKKLPDSLQEFAAEHNLINLSD